MKPEKSIIEFLKELPQPYRDQALENREREIKTGGYYAKYSNKLYPDMPNALIEAFDWDNSPQGDPYWEAVYNGGSPTQTKVEPDNKDLLKRVEDLESCLKDAKNFLEDSDSPIAYAIDQSQSEKCIYMWDRLKSDNQNLVYRIQSLLTNKI